MEKNASSLTIVELMKVLRKSSVFGAAVATVCAVVMYFGGGIYMKRLPEYISTMQVVVATNPKSENTDSKSNLMYTVATDASLVDTYIELIVSYDVVKQAIMNIDNVPADSMGVNQVMSQKSKLFAGVDSQKSKIVTLTAFSEKSGEANRLLKEIVKVSNSKIEGLWDVKNIKILGNPHVTKRNKSMTLIKYTFLAAIVGFLGTWILAVVAATYKKVKNDLNSVA